MKLRALILSCLLIMIVNTNSRAYAADSIQPAGVEAGAVNKKINTEVNNSILNVNEVQKNKADKKQENQYENKLNSSRKINGVVEKTGFILKKVEFEGNTVYSQEQLNKIIDKRIGTYSELIQLKEIIKDLSQYYNDNGYITSFAYLPAQKIKDGVLKVNIVESKISNIKIEGNKWARTSYLKNNMLKAEGIQENKIFNVKDLRKSLGKINETNYLKGRAILQKGEDNESTEIVLNATDRAPLRFNAGWNNQGRDLIGVQRSVLTVGNENLTGFGDRIYASNVLAKDTYGLNTNYFLPLGPYGTELRLGYGYSNVQPGSEYRVQGVEGISHNFSVGLIQPIYEKDNFKVTSDIGLDMLRARTNINSSVLYDKYDLRILRTGLNAIKDDKSGRWISRFEVSTGLPMMGASTEHIHSEKSTSFVKLNPSLIRVQRLPYQTTGILRIAGQYSPDSLLPVEQFQAGGMNSVRGFKEGLNYGDNGYFINLELRKPISFLPDYKYAKLKNKVSFAVFYDQGMARTRGNNQGYKDFLQSAGFGLRINLAKYLYANLDFGIPFGRDRTGDQRGMMFHFNISSDVL